MNDILSKIDKRLDEKKKEYLENDITSTEILDALKKHKNNKSPGPDGIPIEFYKLYWPVVGTDLLEVFRKGLDDSRLAHSQYIAVIKLLYKKGPREEIKKNWRPISLLNTDYKLLSKVLAERIKSVLPEIIHRDQKGGISGRYIGDNSRLIEDILYEMENHDSEAIILMLDMEKAFDRVEWNWLFKVMKGFNFGDRFISWLQTLYSDAKCSILTNGFQSKYYHISRGIRQGDSLSALLFIIQTEPLAQLIRNDDNIEGLTIINDEHSAMIKGCQFVDDLVTVLKNKQYIMPFLPEASFGLRVKFQGESFAFKQWAKSGILQIKDLLKDGTIDEHGIWQKLSHKAGFVFELNKVKKAVPQHWLEWSKLKSIKDCGENDILQFRFQIPNSGIKTLNDLTSKDIYNALLINNETHITSMHYWSRKFNNVDINWEHWFT